jgi:ketosteroid isomerase-like protein
MHFEMKLPPSVTDFIRAQNSRDSDAVGACFAEDAVVRDEDHEMRGLQAIKEWSDKSFKRFQYEIAPTGLDVTGENTVLTATVTGNFPGSPVSLDFNFVLKGDRIATLSVQ